MINLPFTKITSQDTYKIIKEQDIEEDFNELCRQIDETLKENKNKNLQEK
jgi:hypothetical protein